MKVLEILKSEGDHTGHVIGLVSRATPTERKAAREAALEAMTDAFLEHRIYTVERAATLEAIRLAAEKKHADEVAALVKRFGAYGKTGIEAFAKTYFGGKIIRKPAGEFEARTDFPGHEHACFTGSQETLERLEKKNGFPPCAIVVQHATGGVTHVYRWSGALFTDDFQAGGRMLGGLAIRYLVCFHELDKILIDPSALDSDGLVPLVPVGCQSIITSLHGVGEDIRRLTLL